MRPISGAQDEAAGRARSWAQQTDQAPGPAVRGERDVAAEACAEMAVASVALGEVVVALERDQGRIRAELSTAGDRLSVVESELTSTARMLESCREHLAGKAQQVVSLEQRLADSEQRCRYVQSQLNERVTALHEQEELVDRITNRAGYRVVDYLARKTHGVPFVRALARRLSRSLP